MRKDTAPFGSMKQLEAAVHGNNHQYRQRGKREDYMPVYHYTIAQMPMW